jgi:hypothetical protein
VVGNHVAAPAENLADCHFWGKRMKTVKMITRTIGITACLFLAGCQNTLPTSDPNAPKITWAVYDKEAGATQVFNDATGDHFSVSGGHTYWVTIQADNIPGGVHKLTVDASGLFTCATQPDSNGVSFTAPDKLNVLLPHQEQTYWPDSNNTVQTHEFLMNDFNLNGGGLSCGFHHFGGTPGNLEYFATQGSMNFTGTSANYYNVSSQGSFSIGN